MGILNNYFYLFNRTKTTTKTSDDAQLQICYDEGFNASASGLKHTENPYQEGSEQAQAWSRGFWVW